VVSAYRAALDGEPSLHFFLSMRGLTAHRHRDVAHNAPPPALFPADFRPVTSGLASQLVLRRADHAHAAQVLSRVDGLLRGEEQGHSLLMSSVSCPCYHTSS